MLVEYSVSLSYCVQLVTHLALADAINAVVRDVANLARLNSPRNAKSPPREVHVDNDP